MSKLKLVLIVLSMLTIAWLGTLASAATQVRTQRFLSPGNHYIKADRVQPTEDPKIWRIVKINDTIEAEYQYELVEPLNPYVEKAIEIADRPIVVVVDSVKDWEEIPLNKTRAGVYKFKDTYYLIGCRIATMYVEFVDELETVDISKIEIAGIPLGVCWVITGAYHFKRKKALPN
jgi:hypothetical protein